MVVDILGMIQSRIVDKDTIYARRVCVDLNTVEGKQAALETLINDFQKARVKHYSGKTRRHHEHGYFGRKASRRSAHEAWMHKAAEMPTRIEPHPLHPVPYKHTERRR